MTAGRFVAWILIALLTPAILTVWMHNTRIAEELYRRLDSARTLATAAGAGLLAFLLQARFRHIARAEALYARIVDLMDALGEVALNQIGDGTRWKNFESAAHWLRKRWSMIVGESDLHGVPLSPARRALCETLFSELESREAALEGDVPERAEWGSRAIDALKDLKDNLPR